MSEIDNLDYFGDINLNDPNLKPWDGVVTMVPPGEYEFKIVSYEKKPTKKKGEPRLNLKVEVVTEGEAKGKTAFHGFMLAGEGDTWKNRLAHLCKVTGIKADARGGFNLKDLIDKHFIAMVVHGTYTEVDPTTATEVSKPNVNLQKERAVSTGPALGMSANGASTAVGLSAGPSL